MKQVTGNINIRVPFVLIQIFLYGAFLYLDLTGGNVSLSNRIKFSMIILCFCYALLSDKSADKSIIFCLRGALFFTVISDLLILILNYYFFGVLSFIVVQQFYGVRNSIAYYIPFPSSCMSRSIRRSILRRMIFQLIAAGLLINILIPLGVKPDRLFIVSVFYFICIVTNVILSVKTAIVNSGIDNLIFSIGMILFLLCDINVGIFNMAGFISVVKPVYEVLYAFSSILMWTFYAPSQVFLVLSIDDFTVNKYKIQ